MHINDFPTQYKLVINNPAESNRLINKFITNAKNKFKGIIYKFFKNSTDIEDLYIICIAKIIAKIDLFDSEKSSFSTWCHTVINNECLDHIRKNTKNLFGGDFIGTNYKVKTNYSIQIQSVYDLDFTEIDVINNGFINDCYVNSNFDNIFPIEIYIKLLDNLKNNLSEIEYNILYDRYYNELSYDEILLKNNCSLSTVKAVLNRLKTKLKKITDNISPELKSWIDN